MAHQLERSGGLEHHTAAGSMECHMARARGSNLASAQRQAGDVQDFARLGAVQQEVATSAASLPLKKMLPCSGGGRREEGKREHLAQPPKSSQVTPANAALSCRSPEKTELCSVATPMPEHAERRL